MNILSTKIGNQNASPKFPNARNNTTLFVLRLTVMVSVLAISITAGFFISMNVYLYFGGALGLFLIYQTILRWPWLAFAAFVVLSMVGRVPSGLGIIAIYLSMGFLMVFTIASVWLFQMFIVHRRIEIHPNRAVFAAISLGAVAILAFIAGYLPWFPIEGADIEAQITGLGIFVISVFAFLLGAHHVKVQKHLEITVYIYLLMGAALIVGSLIPALQGSVYRLYLAGARGSMLWNWLAALAFGQALINTQLKWRWRFLLFAFVGLLFFVSLGQYRSWVSGWLPPLAAVGMIIWLRVEKLRVFIVAFGIMAIIYFMQTPYWRQLVAENAYSLLTRGATYGVIFEIVKVNPILGLGPSNYYWYTPLYAILGWYVQFNSHNQYVDIIAQTGLLGLGMVFWFAWEMLKNSVRGTRELPHGFARAYSYSVYGGLIGMLVSGMLGDWFIPFVYNIGVRGTSATLLGWFFLGGVIALDAIHRAPVEADLHPTETQLAKQAQRPIFPVS